MEGNRVNDLFLSTLSDRVAKLEKENQNLADALAQVTTRVGLMMNTLARVLGHVRSQEGGSCGPTK